jgi:hypothetical protein
MPRKKRAAPKAQVTATPKRGGRAVGRVVSPADSETEPPTVIPQAIGIGQPVTQQEFRAMKERAAKRATRGTRGSGARRKQAIEQEDKD